MTAAAKKIAKQALALPKSERVEVIHLLQASIPEDEETLSPEEWDKAWEKEIQKRIDEVKGGKVKCIPYAEAKKGWDKILGKA